MQRLPTTIVLAIALAAAGCADTGSMEARYDASLQHWRGATRAELEAAWGRPMLAATADGETVLTWTVRNDLDGRPAPNGPPIVVVSRSNGGGVSSTAVSTASPGMPVAAVVPITCTTRFVMKDGRVASWKFEGMGCGAPY